MIGDSIFIELGDLVVFVLRDIHLVGLHYFISDYLWFMCLMLLESCVSCIDYVLAVICLSCYACCVGVVLLEVGLEIVVWFGIMVGVMLVMFCGGCFLCFVIKFNAADFIGSTAVG